jgi:signal transduction histidine kinase
MVTLHAFLVAWMQLRRTSGEERAALQVFLIGTGITYTGAASLFLQGFRVPLPSYGEFLIIVYVLVVGYLVFRYQFMDIRLVLRRSLVYSLLIACLTAAYLVLVLVLERWTAGMMGYRSFLASVGMAAMIALGFNPLRDYLQAFVDRALFTATPAELAQQREQLLKHVQQGEQLRAVGTLAAGLAHEIKNPLAAIKTFTEHLTARYDDPAFRAKFQQIVGGEVERINLIVQQLLDFAKPSPPQLQPLQVNALLDQTLELLTNELLQHHVTVARRYAATAPILGDPQQLKQVFLNLLLNSLQAMNGTGQLTLTTTPQASTVAITIQDTGCGIPPEHLSRLGEPFFSTKPTGTGLGLAVVQGIVREHRGDFRIQSRAQQGTTVILHLPLAATIQHSLQ